MRVTRENVEDLIAKMETMKEAIEEIENEAQEWVDLQDEDKDEDVRESIRDARSTVEDGLDAIADAATDLVQLLRAKALKAR